MPAWSAEGLALACLVAVLAFAVIRPRGLPEGVAAVPLPCWSLLPIPVFALVVVAVTRAGFVVSSALHIEPFWLAGVVVLATKWLLMDAPGRHRAEVRELLGAANGWFLLFVLGLGVIVRAVVDNGLAAALGHLVPRGSDLVSLLLLAGLAALLANLVNNLPAVLVLLPLAALGRPCDAQLRTGFTEREMTAAAAGVDLLVIARDGDRTRLGPHSIGRHTRFVLDHAPCTVALVWPGEAPGLDSIPAPPRDR